MSKFHEFVEAIPEERRKFYRRCTDVALRIGVLLDEEGLTYEELSEDMGKDVSYIERVLAGGVNLTLKSIAEFEAYFGKDVIEIELPKPDRPKRRGRDN